MKLGFALVLSVGLVSSRASAQGVSDSEIKQRLDLHLTQVGDHARTERYVGGGILLGLGVVSGGAAIAVGTLETGDTARNGALGLGIAGGVLALAGGLILALPTDFERLPVEYRQLPESSAEELRTKIATGEIYLARLAQRARNERLWGGGSLVALAAGSLVLYAASNNQVQDRWLAYDAAFFGGLGVVTFFLKRDAESELDEYKDWKEGRERGRYAIRWQVAPTGIVGKF